MPFLTLTNSKLMVEISDDDYLLLLLMQPFHLAGAGYARTNKSPYEYLHRIVATRIGLSLSLEVDHIDRNKLNCKRDNLRSATRSEQMSNSGLQSNNISGYKGISFDTRRSKWVIQLQRNGKRMLIGRCRTLEEAIIERNNYVKCNGITLIE